MKLVLSALALATLTACATHNPDVIRPYEAQRMSQVWDATVLSVRPVTIDGSQSGLAFSDRPRAKNAGKPTSSAS